MADSAGSATAMFSGVKTRIGMLGLDNRARFNVCDIAAIELASVKSMADWAVEKGMGVGVVTTTRVTHATQGAMYAQTPHRNWETDSAVPAIPAIHLQHFSLKYKNSSLEKERRKPV